MGAIWSGLVILELVYWNRSLELRNKIKMTTARTMAMMMPTKMGNMDSARDWSSLLVPLAPSSVSVGLELPGFDRPGPLESSEFRTALVMIHAREGKPIHSMGNMMSGMKQSELPAESSDRKFQQLAIPPQVMPTIELSVARFQQALNPAVPDTHMLITKLARRIVKGPSATEMLSPVR